MNRQFLAILILAALASFTQAQVPGLGRCPNVSIVQNFDVQRYMGLWYEARSYPFIFSLGGKCITANYKLNTDSTVTVVNTQIRNGREDSITGTATLVTPGVGSLTVKFPTSPITQEGNYNVLYTDYNDLAVVYSCSNFLGFLNLKNVWILTRNRIASQQTIDKAYDVLRDNSVSTVFLSQTNQKNCPEDDTFNTV